MLKEFIIILVIVAIAVALLSIRLLLGKKNFVHTHVDGNPAMEKRGIGCVKRQDREARMNGDFKIRERREKDWR